MHAQRNSEAPLVEPRPHRTAGGTGQELALLLRAWWEASADEAGRKPTQESLARKVGVNQTTLSRYFNPLHPSTAPKDVVHALHAVLTAPPDDLPRALALTEAAPGEAAPLAAADATDTARPTAPSPWTPPGVWRTALTVTATVSIAIASWSVLTHNPPATHTDRSVTAAAGPAAASRWPLVRAGERSSLTWTIQRLLKADGHRLDADGIFGPETRARVIAFQRTRGLQPDGKVGERTWPMLVRTVASGDKGHAVEAVQDLLAQAGLPADITGVYTTATFRAVTDFQTRHGLKPTGTVDTTTWLALTAAVPRP
ncbi:peptidoglycan-binding protein [Streptomyces sp. NPDC048604]|uniref:peptidoglycan-binding protein n=1 Tax=Streptomyces sp. NPDC048604 TaxID=3365578 RepID=UPI003713C5FC